MSRLAASFAAARRDGRAAFIPFIVAGDPDPALTVPFCEALARAGADVIELGVPFSDPLADGPTIQRASLRALARGVGLARSLDLASEARRRVGAALVLFSYYNPILRLGEERFADRAAEAGVDGVLVTDLPLEEGGSLRSLLKARGVDPILLVAPTSGRHRIGLAARETRGFLYCISRTGVTGAREGLPEGLAGEIAIVREASEAIPIAVGFGISTPSQVRAVAGLADGVVIGSALVAVVEEGLGERDGVTEPGREIPGDLPDRLERAAARLFVR